jgi:hypothetical protein
MSFPADLFGTETNLDMLRYNVLQLANALEAAWRLLTTTHRLSVGRSAGFCARLS